MAGHGSARRIPKAPEKDWTPRQIESLKRMWREGYEMTVLVERFGTSQERIRRLAAHLGLKPRSVGHP